MRPDQDFRPGQWVRVTHPNGEMVHWRGRVGEVYEVTPSDVRVRMLSTKDERIRVAFYPHEISHLLPMHRYARDAHIPRIPEPAP